jgi:hypothetical protein
MATYIDSDVESSTKKRHRHRHRSSRHSSSSSSSRQHEHFHHPPVCCQVSNSSFVFAITATRTTRSLQRFETVEQQTPKHSHIQTLLMR